MSERGQPTVAEMRRVAKYMAETMGLHSSAGKLLAKADQLERAVPGTHNWMPAPMGEICRRCRITRQEAIILLRENVCDPGWTEKELNQ
jgi:hypothetical protein